MPSKRTNESVDRILEDLNRRQAEDNVRTGANEQQVNDILKSLGIDEDARGFSPAAQLGPIPDDELPEVAVEGGAAAATDVTLGMDVNDILRELEVYQGAEAPRSAPRAPEPRAPEQTVSYTPLPQKRPARPNPEPVLQPEPEPEPEPAFEPETEPEWEEEWEPEEPARTGAEPHTAEGDTTQTGEIKSFLAQAMQADGQEDSTMILRRKEQFKSFFEHSVAVVPDENGKLPQAEKPARRRGLFGRKLEDSGEITGEFVPINVSLAPGTAKKAEPEPMPEYTPEPEPPRAVQRQPAAPVPQEPAAPVQPERRVYSAGSTARKKKKFGLFGRARGAEREEELSGPAPRAGAAAPEGAAIRWEGETAARAVEPEQTRPAMPRGAVPEDTLASLTAQATIAQAQAAAAKVEAAVRKRGGAGHTGEISLSAAPAPQEELSALIGQQEPPAAGRKKRDTVEFTPGHEPHGPQPAQTPETRSTEPIGEPVMTPNAAVRGAAPAPAAPAAKAAPRQETRASAGEATAGFSVRMDAVSAEQEPPSTAEFAAQRSGAPGSGFAARRDGAPTGEFAAQLGEQPAEQPDTSVFVNHIAQSINRERSAEPLADKYAEAARRLTETEPEEAPPETPQHHAAPGQDKPTRGKIRLAGTPEDEETENGEPPFAEKTAAARHDYEKAEDAPAVSRELDQKILLHTVNAIVTGAIALVLLYLGTAAAGNVLPLPGALDPLVAAPALLGVFLILLGAACAVCWQTMAAGLYGLAKAPTPDTMPALAAVGALVQILAFLIKSDWYTADKLCLFAGPAALLLCFNALGKAIDARTVRANFTMVSAGVDHAAAYRLRDQQVLHAVTRGLGEAKPSVLVSRPTVLLKGFLADSYSHRTSDKTQQQFSWALGICALLALGFNLAWSKDPGRSISAMAAVLCLAAPLAGTLLSALPAQLMQRGAARVGAVIPGWKDIRQLGRVNVIQITARDLFPAGCIRLHGIKTFRKERIDMAIVYAASILVEGSSTLRDVFLGMIGDNRKLLHKVDDLKAIPGKGYVAWVDGNRMLVGNRDLMEQYEIQTPPLEYERRFTVHQRKAIYLAVSGNLFGMFLVGYARDPDTAAVLEGLRRRGISLVVTSDDFNCDVALVESVYSLPAGSAKVLTARECEMLAPATAWLPESEGCMIHLGSFASFVGGMEAAAGAAEGERKAGIVMAASVLIGCLLAVVLSITGGIVSLPLPAMVLYQAAWCVLALLFPLIQKY